jgi:hypothetical protein
MKVTRNVVHDLLPVYFAGEASADTRELVEAFFREDTEFAREAETKLRPQLEAVPASLPPDHETKTLSRTRRILRLRGGLLGCAIFFSLVPFSFVMSDRIQWVMWTDAPSVAIPSLCAGIALWAAYVGTGRRLGTGGS